jgi:hypothetical protein
VEEALEVGRPLEEVEAQFDEAGTTSGGLLSLRNHHVVSCAADDDTDGIDIQGHSNLIGGKDRRQDSRDVRRSLYFTLSAIWPQATRDSFTSDCWKAPSGALQA